ncbi:MAG: hypothetical protein ACRD82_14830 [Blastocatellia bacterium]
MKRNKAAKRWLRKRKRAVKGGLAKLVALAGEPAAAKPNVAPSPTLPQTLTDNSGILRQDVAAFRLPNALAEAGESESHEWMPGKFVLLVVGLAILFIAIVAWKVSVMPAK